MTNLIELGEAQGWNPDTDCWRHGCEHRNAPGQDKATTAHTCRDGERRTIDGELVPTKADVVAWLQDIVHTHCQDTPYAKLALTLLDGQA